VGQHPVFASAGGTRRSLLCAPSEQSSERIEHSDLTGWLRLGYYDNVDS
jgi:hypothetical protein